jgi:hypothetical protein
VHAFTLTQGEIGYLLFGKGKVFLQGFRNSRRYLADFVLANAEIVGVPVIQLLRILPDGGIPVFRDILEHRANDLGD